jgi:hypothetical protein
VQAFGHCSAAFAGRTRMVARGVDATTGVMQR